VHKTWQGPNSGGAGTGLFLIADPKTRLILHENRSTQEPASGHRCVKIGLGVDRTVGSSSESKISQRLSKFFISSRLNHHQQKESNSLLENITALK